MNKTYYPIMAAACLAFGALIPMSSGDENQESPTIKATPIAKDDQMLKELNSGLIIGLNEQAKRWGSFSRRKPTHRISYFLVENSDKKSAVDRTFTVMMKQTPLSKTGKEKNSEYLKIRYDAKDDQLLVKQKDTWIDLNEHPILKSVSKTKAKAKVAPAPISS